jgi:tellurite resistance protein TerC
LGVLPGGKPVPVDEPSTTLSLIAIIVILLITTAGSLLSPRGRLQSTVARARRSTLITNTRLIPPSGKRYSLCCPPKKTRSPCSQQNIGLRIRHADELIELLEQAHRAHDTHRAS